MHYAAFYSDRNLIGLAGEVRADPASVGIGRRSPCVGAAVGSSETHKAVRRRQTRQQKILWEYEN